jgi:alkylation response protein AidB-like acyl-CoA dehydrogenase
MVKKSLALSFAAVFFLIHSPVIGQENSNGINISHAISKDFQNPTETLEFLQKIHGINGTTFVAQAELDTLIHRDGGGSCPSAMAVNLAQALRLMAGLERFQNPHKIALAAFKKYPDLLLGRLRNDQLLQLLNFYGETLSPTIINVETVSAPNSGYRAHLEGWSADFGPDISVSPRQIRVLSYTVTEKNGRALGRHFVILKKSSGNKIDVIDPVNPSKDRQYYLQYKQGEIGPKARLFLNNPPEYPRNDGSIFEINTIFTVNLLNVNHGSGNYLAATAPIDLILQKIDETAKELKGTPSFLDPRAWRKKTAIFGLPGLDLPPEFGGSDWPATKMVEIFRRAGWHNLNFRDVVGGAHARPLLHSKNPEILKIVKQIASGDGYVAIVITEPEAGTDIAAITSSAKKTEGGYLLTGHKRFNARLDQASHVIIFTRSASFGPDKLSAFVVPMDSPELKLERFRAHGLTGNSFGGMTFQDLKVTEGQLLGQDGEGLRIFFNHFLYWRLMQAAAAIGTGENALDQMASRIRNRHVFGGPIGRFTHLQQPIGQHKTELLMAFSLAKEAAARIDRGDYGDETRAIICGIKAEGVEIALKAADAAMRAFGGEGYSDLVDIGDRVRDLTGLRIADGTTDVMRMEVVRKTFGEQFWEMAVQPKTDKENPFKSQSGN